MIAAIRANDLDLPLFLHVLGAMTLVGALSVAAAALVSSWRAPTLAVTRFSFRTLLYAALPAFVVMRITAQWILDKENVPDDTSWVGVGFGVSDLGLLIFIVATVVAGLAMRRAGRGDPGSPTLLRVAAVLSLLLILMYGVAIWAMTTKPT
jgi:hypothetical protein